MEEESSNSNSHQVRVQFSDEINNFKHDSNIKVNVVNQYLVNVHLGFLQIRHKYEITFTFECSDIFKKCFDFGCSNSAYSKIIDFKTIKTTKASKSKPSTTVYSVTAQLHAHKENLMREKVLFQTLEHQPYSITFIFYARVLGNGKGTPLLKDGIKCIGIEPDEDEYNSDFQAN